MNEITNQDIFDEIDATEHCYAEVLKVDMKIQLLKTLVNLWGSLINVSQLKKDSTELKN